MSDIEPWQDWCIECGEMIETGETCGSLDGGWAHGPCLAEYGIEPKYVAGYSNSPERITQPAEGVVCTHAPMCMWCTGIGRQREEYR